MFDIPLFAQTSNGSEQADLVALSSYTASGDKNWDVWAKSASMVPNKEDMILDQPKGVLYEKGGRKLKFQAKEGLYNPNEGDVSLEKDVVLNDFDGSEVRTSKMFWNSKDEILEMKEDVEISKEKSVITGRNLSIEKGKDIGILRENVKIKSLNEDRNLHPSIITCSGKMEVNYKHGYVELFDEVVVSDPHLNLQADYMKVFLDGDTRKVDKVICKGAVRASQDAKRALSDYAEYQVEDEIVYLTGNPRILQDGNVLTGEAITFFLDTQRVVCAPSAQLVLFLSDEDRDFFEL